MNAQKIILRTLRKFRNGADLDQLLDKIPKRTGYKPSRNTLANRLCCLKSKGAAYCVGEHSYFKWFANEVSISCGFLPAVLIQKKCEACGELIVGSPNNKAFNERKYCSVSCAGSGYSEKYTAPYEDKPKATCEVCGLVFIKKFTSAHRACSRECGYELRRVDAENHRKKIYLERTGRDYDKLRGQKRRADKFGCYYEKVDSRKILKRSDYKCAACGVDTPKELRGTYNKRAPEVDHIIPMSKGGPHTEWNMQVLCRYCNGIKHNKQNNEFILKHVIKPPSP